MFFINLVNPLTLILVVIATVLLLFLAQELKKSYIAAIPLIAFLALAVTHVVQLLTLTAEYEYLHASLAMSIAVDCVLIFVTFFGYLWVDDVDAEKNNKKSIDNSLNWLWKKV